MRTIPLSHLAENLDRTLIECAETGETLVIELPDQRLLTIQSIEPQADDELIEELIATNPRFQRLVAESKASPRKTFGGV